MRKQPIVEDVMKTLIRDELAMNPLASVQKIREKLYWRGFASTNKTFLDWHFIAKLMKKIRIENLAKLSLESRIDRLAALKERHRILTEKLLDIVDARSPNGLVGFTQQTQRDRIAAANTIMKWDLALFFAEEQVGLIDEMQVVEQKRTREVITAETISETRTISKGRSGRPLIKRESISPKNHPVVAYPFSHPETVFRQA